MTAVDASSPRSAVSQPWDGLGALVCIGLQSAAGSLLGVALVFLARRLAGGLEQPLSPAAFLVLAVAMALLAGAVRVGWHRASGVYGRTMGQPSLLLELTLSGAVLGLGASLSVPGSNSGALGVFWCVIVGGEIAGWWPWYRGIARRALWRRHSRHGSKAEPPQALADRAGGRLIGTDGAAPELEEPDEDEEFGLLPPGVSQRITRARQDSGAEVIYGIVRCEFDIGERQRHVHLAFCPPLEHPPELVTDELDGPIARIRPTMIETFGAGLEVKLPAASTKPTSVQIQFYAFEKAVQGAEP